MRGHEHGAEQFVGHVSPANQKKANGFVYAELTDVDNTAIRWEQLAAFRIADASDPPRFEICCIPFFAYGISLGDVVLTRRVAAHGLVEFAVTGVAERSGTSTLRVHFLRAADPELAQEKTVQSLTSLGVAVERWSSNMIAVDLSPSVQTQAMQALASLERSQRIEWEFASDY
jgi:hypothetical protein